MFRQGCQLRYAFIVEHRPRFSVRAMCRCLRIHPSGFYAWLKTPLSKRRSGSTGGKPSVIVDNTLARKFGVGTPDKV